MTPSRPGFTLIEQLVALALILIIGAAAVPQVIASVDRARVDRAAASLRGIVEATAAFNRDVKAHNTLTPFPGKLTHLTTVIAATTAGETDICGATYNANEAGRWQGPYLDRSIPSSGLPIGIGVVQNELALVPPDPPADGTMLALVVTGATIEDAMALNARVDGPEGAGAAEQGTVRWTDHGDGTVTLHYLRPVPPC
jgi:prepilin-type N-terminal cleavage/methylation domain-containing protein